MGNLNVKGGTPQRWASLCSTCSWAHVVMGYRESEMVVVCTDVSPNVTVPFKVRECSCYVDKNRPDYDEMRKLAIDVLPASSAKRVGFKIGAAPASREDNEEDDEC